MNLETFFQKFDLFADTPNSVAKMRELVLELAVRGRLVSQDERDGVAREQLAELDLKAAEDYPRFNIPRSWIWAPLEPLLSVMKNGFNGKPNRRGGQYKVTRIETIAREAIDLNRVGFADDLPTSVLEKYLIKSGDILFSHINSDSHLGKTAVCTFNDPTLIHGVNLLLLRPKPQITSAYLNIAFRELRISGYFVGIAQRAINQSSINQKNLGKTFIPVPPLAEQKRIVAKVDDLMALCDRLEAQQQERETRHAALARASLARFADAPTPANLNFIFHKSYDISPADLRKSILTLAVQGKLVPQDPNDEPAEVFLAAIAAKLGKNTADTNDDESNTDTPFALPPGWAWSRFPELGEFGRGKSKHRPRNDPALFVGGTHRMVQTGDVARANGTIQTYTSLYNDLGLAQSRIWPAGTLCITIAANIADSGILGFDACFPDSVVGFIPAEPIPSVRYFEYFMRTAKERLEEFAPSTAQKNINLGILEQVWVPIPPLAEQRRIVAKLDELTALVSTLETQLATARTTAEKLMEAVVAELTDQRSINEPLLQNISPHSHSRNLLVWDLKEGTQCE